VADRGDRRAPVVLVVDPASAAARAVPGSYRAAALTGQRLLAAELTQRVGRLGAAVLPLPVSETPDDAGHAFHWGRWFASAARDALSRASGRVDAIGYAGAGALALLPDAALDELLAPIAGEVVANNRFSADAFVVAGDTAAALAALEASGSDNGAVRALEEAGFRSRDLADALSRFDVDTPLDLALLRLATRLPTARRLDRRIAAFLDMASLPGGRSLEVPHAEALGAVMRDRDAELVVAGRIPSAAWAYLERETACRVRCFVEERGMRSARGHRPRSLLARWARERGAASLVDELSRLGDAVILDTRVLMAALTGSADAAAWPPAEERFASDFGDAGRVSTPWLAELTGAARAASVPVLCGGHALVSDGLRILTDAAWLGR
jgi:hypothetical protein